MSGRENRIRDGGRNREIDRSKECKGPLGYDYDIMMLIDHRLASQHLASRCDVLDQEKLRTHPMQCCTMMLFAT
jgi:hypothetical protein